MIYLLIFLNYIDFYTTAILIDRVGYAVEANPINYWLITTFDTVWAIFVFKAIVLTLFWYTIRNLDGKIITEKVMNIILIVLNVGFATLVTGNMYLVLGV